MNVSSISLLCSFALSALLPGCAFEEEAADDVVVADPQAATRTNLHVNVVTQYAEAEHTGGYAQLMAVFGSGSTRGSMIGLAYAFDNARPTASGKIRLRKKSSVTLRCRRNSEMESKTVQLGEELIIDIGQQYELIGLYCSEGFTATGAEAYTNTCAACFP